MKIYDDAVRLLFTQFFFVNFVPFVVVIKSNI